MPVIDDISVDSHTIPTDEPESDGTLEWDSTTIVLVEVSGGGARGLGYTYGSSACATFVSDKLSSVVCGRDALDVPAAWAAMHRAVRNEGHAGTAAMAMAAVDVALWDLAARLHDVPLCVLLGRVHDAVPVYGSGGFCSYSDERLASQLGGWASAGFGRVKMKVGRDQRADDHRVRVAREAIGPAVELFVDGNGAYSRKEALAWAERFAEHGVTYFEEPVSSDDLEGLCLLRDRGPAGMAIAAGEYGYDLPYFARMIDCVDVQQADVTRCGGITGLLQVGGLCAARGVPFSAHCAPAIHVHACCAIPTLAHLEWFHDHVRIEHLLFDGAPIPQGGVVRPDLSRPGLGLELKTG
jgi:L-alanine-DL-glutamate epimerase-like enolase superfamily enzyme